MERGKQQTALAIGAAMLCACVVGILRPFRSPAHVRVHSGASGVRNGTYLGCGCFWHVQHELVTQLDEAAFHRGPQELSAFAGYAGGTTVAPDGRVCYHSATGVADYGEMGHAEVVSLDMPEAAAAGVAHVFFESVCVSGMRRDVQDWGAEYRSVIGLPGGLGTPAGRKFEAVAKAHGVQLRQGKGDDPDLRGTGVWVYDSALFPFHQAEAYHQFHDDMVERYGPDYNQLRTDLLESGLISRTGCPHDAL